MTAGEALWISAVTGNRCAEVHVQALTFANNICLAHPQQWRVYAQSLALHACFGSDIGEPLEGFDKDRPAIRVAGVVNGIDAAEDFLRTQHFGPAQRHTEHDRIARRHIGDGDALAT